MRWSCILKNQMYALKKINSNKLFIHFKKDNRCEKERIFLCSEIAQNIRQKILTFGGLFFHYKK